MKNCSSKTLEKILASDQVKNHIGEVEKVEEVEEGLNSIYQIKASEEYILKVHSNPRNDLEWFRAEPLIYSRLEDVDFPSPEIVYKELDEEMHENAFFLMEEMPGVNPAGFKEEIDFKALKRIVNHFGRFLAKIHREVKMSDYGMLGGFDGEIQGIKNPEKWTLAVIGSMEELENLIDEGWEEELELDFPSEEEIREVLPSRPEPVLLHLDNRFDNLLVEDDEITAFLDWSHPEAGHYEYDLVRAEYLLIDMDLDFLSEGKRKKLRNSLYTGYRQIRPLEEKGFEERRKIYRKITLMWVLGGFPNWKSKLGQKERKQKKKYLMDKAEREL